jgi:hypothetical protein
MSKLEFPTLRKWDQDEVRVLAFLKHFNQVVDFCRDITGHATEDSHGIAWYVLGAARFQQLYGHPPVIFVDTVLEQRNRQVEYDKYVLQQTVIAYAKAQIYGIWSKDITQMLENKNNSLNYRAMHEHYAYLRVHYRIEDSDVQQLKAAICTPHDRHENIHTFVKAQLNNLRRLTVANHPLNNSIEVEPIKKAYAATEVDRTDFENCFDKFILDNPLEGDRTSAAFTTAVSAYDLKILHHFVAKRKVLETARMPRAHVAQPAGGRGAANGRGGWFLFSHLLLYSWRSGAR